MKLSEAVALIRPGIGEQTGCWADFGAGTGTFTRALAELLGPGGTVLAIDRDPAALRKLRQLDVTRDDSQAAIRTITGDFRDLEAIPELANVVLDGALFANALHSVPDPEVTLANASFYLRPGATMVIIEYDGRSPSPWVPYPLPIDRLHHIANRAGLTTPEVVGQRKSVYRGTLYCAVARRP